MGRDNYCYFIGLLCTHAIAGTLWEITACYLAMRETISWMFLGFMIYSAMWMLMILGLLQYHIMLLASNMTTNEHINAKKYTYMRSVYGQVDSPFNRKVVCLNILDGLFPTTKSYYSRAEIKEDIKKMASGETDSFL